MRIGADTYPLRQGDFVACPTGGPEAAQQIVNTGQDELRYLAASTQRAPEIRECSDAEVTVERISVLRRHRRCRRLLGKVSECADA